MLRRVHRRYGLGAHGRWKTTDTKDLHTRLQRLMTLIFIFWFIIGVGSVSADSLFISARVGDTAVLPCKASDVSNQTHVYWKTDSKVVFERWGALSFQGPGYEGRVDVPKDELHNESCSLVLKNVSITDDAVYRSYIKSGRTHACKRSASTNWHLIQKVNLTVQEPPVPKVRDDVNLDHPHPLMIVFSLFSFLFSTSPFMST